LNHVIIKQPWTYLKLIHHNNNQALRESAKSGYHEIVQRLLNGGADIRACNYEAVTNALEKNHAKAFNVIFNHLKRNDFLDEACDHILKRQDTRMEQRSRTYCTLFESTDTLDILKSVCLLNEVDLAQHVLTNLKTSITTGLTFNINSEIFEFEGQSLLHCAAEQNNPEIIKLLFKFGHTANPKNSDGLTPLQVAQKLGNQEAIDALLTSSTLNIDNNPELQDRCATKKLLEKIPAKTGALTLNKKIDTIKYLCTLVQHKHDVQPLLDKLATIKPENIKNKQSLKGLPVGNIVSFIATNDMPTKLPEKLDGE
jgi:ankyrin repeat protein